MCIFCFDDSRSLFGLKRPRAVPLSFVAEGVIDEASGKAPVPALADPPMRMAGELFRCSFRVCLPMSLQARRSERSIRKDFCGPGPRCLNKREQDVFCSLAEAFDLTPRQRL
jgi:hypothetical protein